MKNLSATTFYTEKLHRYKKKEVWKKTRANSGICTILTYGSIYEGTLRSTEFIKMFSDVFIRQSWDCNTLNTMNLKFIRNFRRYYFRLPVQFKSDYLPQFHVLIAKFIR